MNIREYLMRGRGMHPSMYARRPMEEHKRDEHEGYPHHDSYRHMNYDGRHEMPHYDPYYGTPTMEHTPHHMDYAGAYGGLSKDELYDLAHRLAQNIEEKDRQFFTRENIERKAHELGIILDKFSADELLVATLMEYTIHCMTLKPMVGSNLDVYVKLGRDFLLSDHDRVKGGEKLAVYYDCIIEGKLY